MTTAAAKKKQQQQQSQQLDGGRGGGSGVSGGRNYYPYKNDTHHYDHTRSNTTTTTTTTTRDEETTTCNNSNSFHLPSSSPSSSLSLSSGKMKEKEEQDEDYHKIDSTTTTSRSSRKRIRRSTSDRLTITTSVMPVMSSSLRLLLLLCFLAAVVTTILVTFIFVDRDISYNHHLGIPAVPTTTPTTAKSTQPDKMLRSPRHYIKDSCDYDYYYYYYGSTIGALSGRSTVVDVPNEVVVGGGSSTHNYDPTACFHYQRMESEFFDHPHIYSRSRNSSSSNNNIFDFVEAIVDYIWTFLRNVAVTRRITPFVNAVDAFTTFHTAPCRHPLLQLQEDTVRRSRSFELHPAVVNTKQKVSPLSPSSTSSASLHFRKYKMMQKTTTTGLF